MPAFFVPIGGIGGKLTKSPTACRSRNGGQNRRTKGLQSAEGAPLDTGRLPQKRWTRLMTARWSHNEIVHHATDIGRKDTAD